MTLFYDFKEGPVKNDPETPPMLYPHVIPNGTVSTRTLIRTVASRCTFSPGELQGMLTQLTDEIIRRLLDGYRVQLGEMGYLSLKLKTDRPVTDKKAIRAESVYIANVNFRAAAGFRKKLHGELRRNRNKTFRKSAGLSPEKRKERLLAYLATTPYLTCSRYMELTGLLRKKALEDLHGYVEEGVLKCNGKGVHLIFSLSDAQ